MLKVGCHLRRELHDEFLSYIESYPVYYIVYFWSKSCHSCHVNLPQIQEIKNKYLYRNVFCISIHRPMGDYDLDINNILEIAKNLHITEKLLFDNDHAIGDELGVDSLPTYFLFDKDGKVRRHAKGQFGVKMIEQALIRLFDGEGNADEAREKEKEKSPEAVTESFPLSF